MREDVQLLLLTVLVISCVWNWLIANMHGSVNAGFTCTIAYELHNFGLSGYNTGTLIWCRADLFLERRREKNIWTVFCMVRSHYIRTKWRHKNMASQGHLHKRLRYLSPKPQRTKWFKMWACMAINLGLGGEYVNIGGALNVSLHFFMPATRQAPSLPLGMSW